MQNRYGTINWKGSLIIIILNFAKINIKVCNKYSCIFLLIIYAKYIKCMKHA